MAKTRKSNEFREGFSLTRFIATPFRLVADFFERRDQSLSETSQSNISRKVISVLVFPFRFIADAFYLLLTSWSVSRSGKAFLKGLPALLTILFLFFGIGLANYFYKNIVFNAYQANTLNSMGRERYHVALLYLSRLIRENPGEEQLKMTYGIAKIELGEEELGFGIMNQLAPEERVGYGPAHHWLASRYLEDLGLDKDEKLEKAKKHAQFALQDNPENMRLQLLLATIADQRFETDEVISIYKRVIDYQFPPGTDVSIEWQILQLIGTPRLAELLIERGENETAALYLDRAIKKLQLITTQYPDNLEPWVLTVKCYLAAKKYQNAAVTIQTAQRISADPTIRARLRLIYAELFMELAKEFEDPKDMSSFHNRLYAVGSSFATNHRNANAIDALIDLCLNPQTNHESIDDWLRQDAVNPTPPEIRHVILGSRASLQGNTSEAQSHYSIAESISPNTPAYINVLSYRLADKDERAEAALRLINVALEVWAGEPNLSHTRGFILMKLGRLDEAKPELEFALSKMDNNIPLRRTLVEFYKLEGNAEESEKHATVLEQLLNELQMAQQSKL